MKPDDNSHHRPEESKKKTSLGFPSLASLTLAACGGGGGGGSNVQPTPPNRSPTAAADKTVTLDEDAVDQALGITAPTDPDGGNLTISVTAVPTGGTLKIADGTEVTSNTTLTISQLTGLVFTPDANLNSDTTEFGAFTYTVSDGTLSDSGTVTISVSAVNDAPELVGVMEFALNENATSVAVITATDTEGDTLTYSISGGADQALFAIDASTGALSFKTAPDYESPQDSNQNNVYSVQVTVSDGKEGSASQTYVITVNNLNEALIIGSDTASTNEDTAVSINVLANDSDPDGNTLSVTAATASNGTVAINSDYTLSYTPNANFNGT
ncbi:MAG: Ig-like domain-containing protein, partial [Pseudomonadota bacterium]|nr:Ig-like domain-containing protein [Pseudomonadota bacterium]